MGEKIDSDCRYEVAGREIAIKYAEEKIAYYLSIAKESVDKSNTAILGGLAIILLGVFLKVLIRIAASYGLARYASPALEYWLAQGVFVLIGAYLSYQGFICKVEAANQIKVMAAALKAKKE